VTDPTDRFGSYSQFQNPKSVACNSRGDILVAEYFNHRIQVYDRNKKVLPAFGTQGSRRGEFSGPSHVFFNRKTNEIVVSDTLNHRLQIFDEKGAFKMAFGEHGTGDGQFQFPFGVVDSEGNYVVADQNNNRVQIFDPAGKYLRKFGSEGIENGQLRQPVGLGILSNGNIVVSEYDNHRLQIFSPQDQFHSVSFLGAEMLKNPCGLCVDSEDRIYVADSGYQRVLIFLQTGQLMKIIKTGVLSPSGVCVDHDDRIIICGESEVLMYGILRTR